MARSRLDEMHAHQFSQQRVVNALVWHDPDPSTRFPRAMPLVLAGLFVAVLIAAAILVINKATGNGTPTNLRDSSTVLIESESGAAFVYVKADDQLHPVLNYASGLLIADGSGGAPTTVRRSWLASLRRTSGVQIGATLGIPDAPNALPRPADLLADPWQVCTRGDGGNGAGPRTDLLIGAGPLSGGHQLAAATPSSAGEALLLKGPDQTVYLVFGGRKLRLRQPGTVLAAFGWTGRTPQLASAGWLNTLPTGPDVATPTIDGLHETSRVVPEAVGRLYRAPGPTVDQWAVVQRDRVQPISEVMARLLQADPRINAGDPIKVGTAQFAALPGVNTPGVSGPGQDQLPSAVPAMASIGSSACLRVSDSTGEVPAVIVDPPAASPAAVSRVASGLDQVSVPFGHGVLVRAAASPTAPASSGTISIITDSGMRYPIADHDALTRLGYGASTPLAMPAGLVSLVPVGPALSVAAAMHGR